MSIRDQLINWLFRFKKFNLLLVICLLALGTLMVPKIEITGNLGGFDAPGVRLFSDAKAFDSLFGGVRNKVFITITPKVKSGYGLWDECGKLEHSLMKQMPGVEVVSPRRFVRSYYPIVDPLKLLTADSILKEMKNHPQLTKLIAKDGKSFLIIAGFKNDSFQLDSIKRIVNQSFKHIEKVRTFGIVELEAAIEETLAVDILKVALCIGLFFTLFIFWVYRSLSAIVFALVSMGVSIWLTVCLFPVFGYQINVITILALPIVLVLSLSDSIHLLSGLEKSKDSREIISWYVFPSLYSSLTTSVAFFSFYFNDSPFIRQLGLLTGVALILEFVVSFAIAPILLDKVKTDFKTPAILKGFENAILRYKKIIALVLLVFAVGSVFLVKDLRFKSDSEAFFPVNHEITKNHQFLNDQFYTQITLNVWLENDQHRLSTEAFLGNTYDFLDQLEKREGILNYSEPRDTFTWGKIIEIDEKATQEAGSGYYQFINEDSTRVRCELYFSSPDALVDFYSKNESLFTNNSKLGIHVFSNALLYDHINKSIAKSLFYSLTTSGLAIMLMLWILSGSFQQAVIGMLPNLVPLSVAIWIFTLFGFSLNILTAITAVVCIGLLDDDTIHILYRRFVLKKSISTLSNSVVNTAILLSIGFGFFMLSDFYPTQVFGGVSALVFLFGILGELTIFQLVVDWIISRKGGEKDV